jgi:xylan 1,4-beta-xylosidase
MPASRPAESGAERRPHRAIQIDLASPATARDRFTEFCVGSDYPGTLLRDDSLAQLRLVREELGFR